MAAHEEKNASPPMRGAHPHGLCREAGSGRERRRPWSARSGLPILLPRGEVLRPCSECGTRNGGSSSPEVVLQAFLGTQTRAILVASGTTWPARHPSTLH